MHQTMPLIVTLASGFGLALVLGFIAARIGLPALVGYLLAGVLIGPHTPGFVADVELAKQLAEIGVMLLMFSVGLHFPIGNLLAVKRIALPGAIVQMDERSLHSHRDHSNRRAGCARSTQRRRSRVAPTTSPQPRQAVTATTSRCSTVEARNHRPPTGTRRGPPSTVPVPVLRVLTAETLDQSADRP
jgi:hypothetical protein